jgi:oligopeptide transport system substrate-binding protein
MRMGLGRLPKFTASGLMVLVGVVAILLAGCGTTSSGATPLPDSQQIFRFPLNANSVDIKTMDPAQVQDYYSYFPVELVFPSMLALSSSGTPIPWAAQAMPTFNAADDTYTFKIRPNLKWSDGTPIDANTFAYSINRALSPCTASPVTYYLFALKDASTFATQSCQADGVTVKGKIPTLIGDSINVPDSQTLVLTLSAPAPYFLEAICYPTADAQPEQLISKYGPKAWTQHLTDGTGFGGNQYKLVSWTHKGDVIVERNDSFWGTKPKLREVDFKVYQTVNAEYADYLAGRLDQGAAPPDQYKTSKQRSDFHEEGALWINYYQPVWTKAPFNSVLVRQAFDLALNKDVLANQVNQGSVIPSNHIVPQGMPGYNPTLTGPDGTTSTSGNVAMATKLMDQYATKSCKGYKAGSDQFQTCTPVTLFDSNDPSIVTNDQAAVAMWQAAFPGYPIKTSFTDFNTLISQIYGPNVPQIYGIAWIADYPDPQDWLSLQFAPTAINNAGFVNDPTANALMAKADVDLGSDRMSLYNQAEQSLVDQGAWITQSQQKLFWNLPTYVHNFTLTSQGLLPLGGDGGTSGSGASWETIFLSSH